MKNLWFGHPGFGPNCLGPIRYLIPYGLRFYNSSLMHDYHYSEGGTEDDRESADVWLLTEMEEACETNLQKKFAHLYYLCVRKLGYLFFNYHKSYEI